MSSTLAERTEDVRADILPQQAITLSTQERAARSLTAENHSLATAILACRGYVILKDALEPDFAASLGREMEELYADCQQTLADETGTAPDAGFKVHVSEKKRATFWFRKSRWRIFPRLTGPMGDPRLLANPFVVPILEQLLGKDFYCKYVSSDTCVKGAILQSPHSDIDGEKVFVDNEWRPRGFIVNVPVMECGLHNGPLEVWPGGSHMWGASLLRPFGLVPNVQDGRNPPVERLAQYFPSIRVVLKPGEILIRDLAMWHRGTPNPTDSQRTMLTIGMFRGDYEYGYGDAKYNLDAELYQQLDPRIQKMFAHAYGPGAAFRLKRKKIVAGVRRRVERLFGAAPKPEY